MNPVTITAIASLKAVPSCEQHPKIFNPLLCHGLHHFWGSILYAQEKEHTVGANSAFFPA